VRATFHNLTLPARPALVMVPPSSIAMERPRQNTGPDAALALWVRGTLVAIALGLTAVFALALYIRPYDGDGRPLLMATHRQLGLPPCTFYAWTKLPCPSCGMTSSFSLLVHGDVWNSLRANAVGTLLAAFCLALVPWNLACAARGRFFFIGPWEQVLTRLVIAFLILLLGRWLVVVGLIFWGR
jgi:hypothetical protein